MKCLVNVPLKRLLTILTAVLFLLLSPRALAQTMTVEGVVYDKDHAVIPGVSVYDKDNPDNLTTSGLDGTYTITVLPGARLEFSYMGFRTQLVEVAGRAAVDVTMEEDSFLLEEMVVIGYGTIKKSDLTGSVSRVGGNVLADKPVASFGQALQGRAAGVYVVDNGNPQENVSIKIRGLGTINDSNPLYVIDGAPMSMGLNSINMLDIESIDILKDASATAIYGSRGANGVVLITTKKGKQGDGKISVKANVGVAQATDMPRMLNAAQYAELSNEMLSAGGVAPNPAWSDPASLGEGTNWIDAMFNPALSQIYSLSYSGGGDKNNYYVSGSYSDIDGIVKSVGYKRLTLQLNGTHKVKPWIEFGHNISFSYDKKTSGTYSLNDVFRSLPTQPIFEEDGTYAGPEGNSYWVGNIRNQYGTAEINKNLTQGYNLLGTIYAEASIFKGLKFKSLGSVEAKFAYNTNFIPAYNWKPTEVADSSLEKGTGRYFSYLWDNYFTYGRTFGKHSINAMAGASLQWGSEDYFKGTKDEFLKDEVNQLKNATNIKSFTGSGSEWALVSFMFRANYSYADRYYATVTVREDASSRFGANNRWGTFPSFSLAWRLSNESWFNRHGFVSDLKLRAGYGVTGNQNIGNYTFASTFNTGLYVFNGEPVSTLVANKMPNPNVHWEEVKQFNIGVDLGFLENRLRLSVDAYDKNTDDMLVAMAVPVSSGYSDIDVPYINAGKVNNKGIEVTLSADIFSRKDFNWTSDFNITFNKNKIVSLNSDTPMYYGSVEMLGNTRVNMEGYPIGSFFGNVMGGIFQNQAEVDNWAVQVAGGTAPGDIKFLDLNSDGVIDDYDRTIIGNPNPDFFFSWNNRLTYKNFDLELFLQGVCGNEVYNANRIYLEGMSVAFNQYATVLNRWTGEGTSNDMPRTVYGDPNKNLRSSNRFVEDGSYLRIKNLSLGYTLPKGFRVYLSCQNLFTLTNYSGFDPEVGIEGYDLGNYPVTRTISLGLDITF